MTIPHSAASRLRAHVQMLAGTIGERNLWRVRSTGSRGALHLGAVLQRRLRARVTDVRGGKIPVRNVEATLTGAANAAEIVVVGAHYDSVSGCPAANDNGTGVAAVLELAQRYSRAAAAAHDPVRGVRQRRAAILPYRANGQRRLCERGEGSRRSDHGDAGAGDDGLLLGQEREPAVSRRRSPRTTRTSGTSSASSRTTLRSACCCSHGRHSSSGRDFRCRPSQPRTMSPASAGRITGRSGRPAMRR